MNRHLSHVGSFLQMTNRAVGGLAHFIHRALDSRLEPVRLARAGWALLASGCSASATFPGHSLASYLIAAQPDDGGWADVEETLWCLGYLSAFGSDYSPQVAHGTLWLASMRQPCGAWGRTRRDRPRIPVTGLLSAVMPEIVERPALDWLSCKWQKDLASSVQLTYKGAFFLLAQGHPQAPVSDDLVERTITLLCSEQEEDGGFAPWKGHPVQSDPWCTGVVLWGLSRFAARVPAQTLERGMSWLQSRQLPDGLWPYHYIDDGTALALIGAASVLRSMLER